MPEKTVHVTDASAWLCPRGPAVVHSCHALLPCVSLQAWLQASASRLWKTLPTEHSQHRDLHVLLALRCLVVFSQVPLSCACSHHFGTCAPRSCASPSAYGGNPEVIALAKNDATLSKALATSQRVGSVLLKQEEQEVVAVKKLTQVRELHAKDAWSVWLWILTPLSASVFQAYTRLARVGLAAAGFAQKAQLPGPRRALRLSARGGVGMLRGKS
eukprot:364933-Chlamydomonas_euryale.AAC.26